MRSPPTPSGGGFGIPSRSLDPWHDRRAEIIPLHCVPPLLGGKGISHVGVGHENVQSVRGGLPQPARVDRAVPAWRIASTRFTCSRRPLQLFVTPPPAPLPLRPHSTVHVRFLPASETRALTQASIRNLAAYVELHDRWLARRAHPRHLGPVCTPHHHPDLLLVLPLLLL
jgi:hypothetical protein